MVDQDAAHHFIYAHGRVLERRLFAALFEGADPAAVVDCLRAFQNADGGFGHGLEPDSRAPGSQPLDVEIAFEYLAAVGCAASELVTPACDWLATLADEQGAVPILLPSIAGYPRAAHWTATDYAPDLNPTAAICAHVHALGLSHPWVAQATEGCLDALESGAVPGEAHALLGLTKLLAHLPDRARAKALAPMISDALPSASFYAFDAAADSYGVTPLQFAPDDSAFAREWFSAETISAHVQRLASQQEADGGWPIGWEPVSEATRSEWRSIRTIGALRVLGATTAEP